MTDEEITEIPKYNAPTPIFSHQSTGVEARNPGLKQDCHGHIKKRGGRTVTCREKPRSKQDS
jgi:hypothetical protein